MKNNKVNKFITMLLVVVMALTCTPMIIFAEEIPDTTNTNPKPAVYFDMDTLTEGKITNKADGAELTVKGNTPTLVVGKGGHGQALKFDGSTYIDIGKIFQPKNAYTMMAWIKQDAGGKATQAIVSRGNSGNVNNQLAMLLKEKQIYHCVAFSNGSINNNYKEAFGSASVEKEVWNHIAVIREGRNLIYYVNGVEVLKKTDLPTADIVETDMPMYIGKDANSLGSLWNEHDFTGLMDDLKLYSVALTQEQVKEAAQIKAVHSITTFNNGKLVISFEETPNFEPIQEDFTLSFKVDGKTINSNIKTYVYDGTNKTATFVFDPIVNYNSVEKTVSVTAKYDMYEESEVFVLPAGSNSAPVISNATVENLSPKLGTEPHVKGILKVKYTFNDADNDAEGETKYQWYISDTVDGEYSKLQGINTQTIILLDKYVGKYLKCEVKAVDIHGNRAAISVMSAATGPVLATEGNPLTDWFLEAQYGVSHHILSEFVNLDFVSTKPGEKWDRNQQTWNEFIGEFDAEKYAEQISQTGAKYIIVTLGQNAAEYCAPNEVYDQYLREAGLLGEGEVNPKTASMENDLPMKIADAVAPYGIKVMLYLPSNPPHSAHWNPGDYRVTVDALKGIRGSNGPVSQEAKKIHVEMVEWWSKHYGDKIAGWWFDGMYPGGILESQNNMSLEYNVSTLANAAKSGNPYSIVTFNQGTSPSIAFAKNTEYHDYTAGEINNFDIFPYEGRWAKNTTDVQNFLFGPLGTGGWGWGAAGTSKTIEYVENKARTAIAKSYVIGFDTKVNHFGEIDPAQLAQLKELKDRLATKLLTGITAPVAITGLANGTAKTAAALGLPATVELVTDAGRMNANVAWNVEASSYDPAIKAEQTFTVEGTVTLPEGVKNPNNVTLTTRIQVTVLQASTQPQSSLTGAHQVVPDQTFDITMGLSGVKESVYQQIYAQDLTLHYDPANVKFDSVTSLRDGFEVIDQKETVPGQIRILAASVGANQGVPAQGDMLKFKFTVKSDTKATDTTFSVGEVAIANGEGNELQVNGNSHKLQISTSVDKALLNAAIASAQTMHDAAVEGNGHGLYLSGSKTKLQSAIDAARATSIDPIATQQQVDSAKSALEAAIQVFESKKISADVNGKDGITVGDLAIVAAVYGKQEGQPGWNPKADVNHDGKVDIEDLAIIAKAILR
ncbi:LamG-like jellyroll fold domain-containing protein [Paenibacillus sp. GCM10027629]|uniref:LamG-like jellyroll fold domain-containing protein n=1 Tax=Paenibacillus sp. GCM10027629 TaxID=3273414 RepID=UPI003624E44A